MRSSLSRRALRVGPFSIVVRPLTVAVSIVLLAALFLVFCLEIALGDYPMSIPDVVSVLLGGGSKAQRFIVQDLRLPRALTGVLVGAALGIAGALTQSVSRNALASPDILGITAGATTAAVSLIVLGGGGAFVGILALLGLPLAALVGGLLTAIVIYALSWRGGIEGYRLILIGIGINAMLVAVTGWLMVSADINDVSRAQVWLNGSLNGATWNQVWPVAVVVAVVGASVLIASFTIGGLRLGDENATSLGIKVQSAQGRLLLASVVLAAVATAAAGPVGFVALAAPQIAMRLIRSAGPPIFTSAICGAVLVVGSDLIARTVLPVELPVGIVTSALGGPFLLYLLVRNNRKVTA
ncbi:iron chelate uptake ABC transporter family permease subunit [Rhodococcus sp. HNM0569]|uniref:FecCD family ABC transporter permease n=1 Tax=Rhodococcus sp. HNM0569 TaxID=2716340 RepID=UPI00146C3BE4|nr:iron chelate uptake ABC transporter family permease subunit [Rhodococcus sp. HNM0569]NLU84763.1 iron chelate uptake ABC transporter family permease subunit [Rhodococcus sp. HNM0569]